jgi:hypothetical protein
MTGASPHTPLALDGAKTFNTMQIKEATNMRKLSVLLAVALLAAMIPFAGTPVSLTAATCSVTLAAGSDIQTAIDAANAGDVICLNAGIYSPPSQINVNKSVTLQGPQAGVDPRPSAGSTRVPGDATSEAIIDGTAGTLSGIIVIAADNVVLDGLEVRKGSGDLIDSESSIPTGGTIVRYNIIDGATGDEGMQLRAVTNGLVEYNYIFDIAQDGINMCCGSNGGTIQHNEVSDNNSENAAIYLYDTTNMTIKCNLVHNVNVNDGIKLGAKGGDDAANVGGSILYNTVHDTAQDGISVYMSETLVEGNEVYNSSSENGAIYVAWAVSNVSITMNDVHGNTLNTGKWSGENGAVLLGVDVDASTVLVNQNNIVGNSPHGVSNKGAGTLNATNNWWGAAGAYVFGDVTSDPVRTAPVVIPDPCAPNEPPVADANGPYLVAVEQSVALDGSGSSDPDEDPLSEAWAVTGDPLGTIAGSTFTAGLDAGITEVTLTVDDGRGGTATDAAMVVVYDPDGGFVTGGGWIDSPEGATAGQEAIVFFNGFEADISGWDVFGGSFNAVRVISGSNGVSSSSGDWRAEVGTAATSWGAYNSEFPAGGYITSVDVYLDVDGGFTNDTRFDWTSAINGPDGNHRRDFVFNGGFYNDADGSPGSGSSRFIFSASNNAGRANSYPKNPGRDPIAVTSSGWYTFQHRFYDIGGGVLAVDLSILDSLGTTIHSWTLSDTTDIIGSTIGGNRYGWFATNEFPFLAIDNSLRTGLTSPTGRANFGFVSKYKKGADTPTGNTEFVFQAADLNFHSSSYDWLLVTGKDYAKFKGSGTINGEGEYRFMLWAGDGDSDTFRIRIWEEDELGNETDIYDNGFNQEIGGGSIVVHTKK